MKPRSERRERILEVSQKHLERYGYKRTVIDDIVREVGIAKGSFYLEFKSKEELFIEVVKKIRHENVGEYMAILDRETTAAGKLRAALTFSLEMLHQAPIIANLLSDDPDFHLPYKLREGLQMREELEQSLALLRQLLEEGIANGEFRSDLDLDAMPFVLRSLIFLHFYREQSGYENVSRDQFIKNLIQLAMHGILEPLSKEI